MFQHNHPPRSSSRQAGQNLVEYAIIILLVGIAVVLALTALRPAIENAFARFIANAPVAPPSLGPIGGQFTPRTSPSVAFSAQAYQASEATGSVSIQVTLSYPYSQPITVDVVTVAGSATSPDDFTSATFSLTFAANETAKTVTITLINDTTVEDDEDFEVQLANASVPLARATDTLGLCAFARSTSGDFEVAVRAFHCGVGILEDPASGAANGLIAAYIAHAEPHGPLAGGYRVSQGREIGRDAKLRIPIGFDGSVWVGGCTQTVFDGQLNWMLSVVTQLLRHLHF